MVMNTVSSTRKALFYMIKQKNGASQKDLADFLNEREYVGKSGSQKQMEYIKWNLRNGYSSR